MLTIELEMLWLGLLQFLGWALRNSLLLQLELLLLVQILYIGDLLVGGHRAVVVLLLHVDLVLHIALVAKVLSALHLLLLQLQLSLVLVELVEHGGRLSLVQVVGLTVELGVVHLLDMNRKVY